MMKAIAERKRSPPMPAKAVLERVSSWANRSGAMNFGSLNSMVTRRAIDGKKLMATAGRMPQGHRAEGLHRDIQRQEDQHRRQHRQGNQFDSSWTPTPAFRPPDENSGEPGVAGAGTHLLEGRVSDVGSRLRDAARQSREQGCGCLGQ